VLTARIRSDRTVFLRSVDREYSVVDLAIAV
jgi:hypothetical protein